MTLTAYHLLFDSPLHVGVEGIGQERIEHTIRSDTLWAALVQMWSLLFDESPQDLAAACPFAVSSCFPLVKGQRFYPLPDTAREDLATALQKTGEAQAGLRFKDIKKIKFINEQLLLRVLQADRLQLNDLEPSGSHFPHVKGKDAAYAATEQRPRLRIDRLSGSVEGENFFYCSDLFFHDQSGLFFLMRCQDDAVRTRFEAALHLLGDTGLGADRTVGRGTFTCTAQPAQFPDPQHAGCFLLLSLYHPTREEVQAGTLQQALGYSLVRRSGHAGAPGVGSLRRADVWMLGEGSMLVAPVQGDIPEVIAASTLAPHPVYRYGRAFLMPMAARRPACPNQ